MEAACRRQVTVSHTPAEANKFNALKANWRKSQKLVHFQLVSPLQRCPSSPQRRLLLRPPKEEKRGGTESDKKQKREKKSIKQRQTPRWQEGMLGAFPCLVSGLHCASVSVTPTLSRNTEYLATTRCVFVLRRQSNIPSAVHSYLMSPITMLCYTVGHYNCAMNQHFAAVTKI